MNLLSRLDWLWKDNKKFVIRYTLLFAGSVFTHAVLAGVCGIYGARFLCMLNLAAIVMFFLWAGLIIRFGINDLLLVAPVFDVVIMSGIHNVILGFAPGVYLYSLTVIPAMFFFSARDAKVKNPQIITGLLTVMSITVMLCTLSVPAKAPLTQAQNMGFFQVNLLICALLLSLYSWEFLTESRSTQKDLSHIAEYDQLTGVRSRYSLHKLTEGIHGTQYCVIMSDVDRFKAVNDTYGHAVGDRVLSEIGKTLQSCMRRDDIVCRWGGEEFLMVIHADLETAQAVAQRIRRKLTAVVVESGQDKIGVTMTLGIADCLEADSFDKTVAIADANLLRGKQAGRNCVVTSTNAPQTDGVPQPVQDELDTSNLQGAVFSAFAATSDTTYVYICNLSTNVSRWSKTAVEYFGLPGEYMYDAGNIWMGFVHPDDRALYAEDVEAVLSGRKNFHDVTYRARNKNGEYVRCVCKGVVTEGNAAQPAMFAGTITNLGVAESN